MARDFNGTTDLGQATITPTVDTEDWTMGPMWVYADTVGEINGTMMAILDGATIRGRMRWGGATFTLNAFDDAVADSVSTSSTTLGAGQWWCVSGAYRHSDRKIRFYYGDLDSAMAEVSYTTQTAGSGARTASAEIVVIGAGTTAAATAFDGRIADTMFSAREWTLAELEAFRMTGRIINPTALRGFWPLWGVAGTEADLSGNAANAAMTGTVAAAHPPVARYAPMPPANQEAFLATAQYPPRGNLKRINAAAQRASRW